MVMGSVNAQVIFHEDFDGVAGPTAGGPGTYNFPTGWLLRNVDARTPASAVAYVNDAWERREDFAASVLDSCAFSNSWYSPAGAANDWMWTPAIQLPAAGAIMLSWRGKVYDADFRDGYEVRIMGNGQTPTGGTGTIGNQITNSTLLFSIPEENTTWTTREVSLASYAGQSVRIAFRNNSVDKFLLLIDDVMVSVPILQGAELVDVVKSEYTLVPFNQRSPLTLSAKIKSTGSSSLSAYLRVQAFDAGNNQVYTANSPTVTLANQNDVSALLTVDGAFEPTAEGVYTFKYQTMLASDNSPLGNEQSFSMTYTATEMARDNGTVTGTLGIGAGNGGYLGQSFAIASDAQLKNVEIFQNGNAETVPVEMGCAVFKLVAGVPELLFATPSQMIAAGAPGSLMNYTIDPPLNVAAGDVIVVCAQEYGQTLSVGLTDQIFTTGTTYVDWPTSPLPGWGHNEDFGANFAKSYVIRPHLYCIMEAPEATAQDFCGTPTVAQLQATGNNLQWYADATGGTPLDNSTLLVNGNYYVSQTEDSCESARVEVAVTVTPETANTTTVSECETYTWAVNGSTYTDSGTYTSVDGCHTEILELTITPETSNTETVDACGSYLWELDGNTYTDSGSYTVVDGCHTEILVLSIVPAISITADPQDVAVTEGESVEFTATVSGTASYQWQMSDDNGANWANVAEGNGFSGTQTATLTIDGTAVNTGLNGLQFQLVVENGVCDELISQAATLSVTLGVNQFAAQQIKLYPNPTSARVNIELGASAQGKVEIFDLNGRMMQSATLQGQSQSINMAGMASGVYFFKITTDQGNTVRKVVKQ